MKNFKRVLSLALAALMVIGGLVIAPVDAKADDTYNRVWDQRDVANGGEFVIVYQTGDKYYALGNTYAKEKRPTTVEVTITNNTVTLVDGTTAELPKWKLEKNGDKEGTEVARVKMSCQAGQYWQYKTGTKFEIVAENPSSWVVSEVENDLFTISTVSGDKYVSLYNTDFRPYALNATEAKSQKCMLFKTGSVISEEDDVDSNASPTYDTYEKIVDAAFELESNKSLKDPGDGSTSFELKGKVVALEGNLTYSPFSPIVWIEVEGKEGKLIECYGLKAGAVTDVSKVTVGDIITVNGPIKNYKGTIEFNGCTLEEYVAGSGNGTYANQQAIVDAVLALNSGYGIGGTHTLGGVISAIDGKEVTFKIGDATLVVYKPYDAEGTELDLSNAKTGDTISVTGNVKNDENTIKFGNYSKAVVTPASSGEGGSGSGDEGNGGSGNGGQTPTAGTIAEALAAETGAKYSVKGVVTMIEGKNVFVQDATGAICIYLSAAPTDLALGDTIEAQGEKDAYNGLPELKNATYTKSLGMTLSAKETTIDALTTSDICKYVKLTGLEVVEVYDNNGQFSAPNIKVTDGTNEIQIYKAVVNKDGDNKWAIKVGDKINVLAAVGINKTTLQLRTTNAEEITVVTNNIGNTGDVDTTVVVFILLAGVALLGLSVLGKKKFA